MSCLRRAIRGTSAMNWTHQLKMSEEKEGQDIPVNARTIRRPHRYAEMRKVNGNDAFTEVLQRVRGKFHYDRGDLLCNTAPSSGRLCWQKVWRRTNRTGELILQEDTISAVPGGGLNQPSFDRLLNWSCSLNQQKTLHVLWCVVFLPV